MMSYLYDAMGGIKPLSLCYKAPSGQKVEKLRSCMDLADKTLRSLNDTSAAYEMPEYRMINAGIVRYSGRDFTFAAAYASGASISIYICTDLCKGLRYVGSYNDRFTMVDEILKEREF